jgi:hypothetical protein
MAGSDSNVFEDECANQEIHLVSEWIETAAQAGRLSKCVSRAGFV